MPIIRSSDSSEGPLRRYKWQSGRQAAGRSYFLEENPSWAVATSRGRVRTL
jgi:hypothetical protein